MAKRKFRLYIKLLYGIIVLASIGLIYSIYSRNLFAFVIAILLVIGTLYLKKRVNEILKILVESKEKINDKKVI